MNTEARTCGMLLKKGGSKGTGLVLSLTPHRRNWQARWFQLDLEQGELRYYRDATLSKAKGVVRFTPASVLKIPGAVELRGRHRPTLAGGDELNYFEVHSVLDGKGAARKRPFMMRAPRAVEMLEWIQSITLSIRMVRHAAGLISPATRSRAASHVQAASMMGSQNHPDDAGLLVGGPPFFRDDDDTDTDDDDDVADAELFEPEGFARFFAEQGLDPSGAVVTSATTRTAKAQLEESQRPHSIPDDAALPPYTSLNQALERAASDLRQHQQGTPQDMDPRHHTRRLSNDDASTAPLAPSPGRRHHDSAEAAQLRAAPPPQPPLSSPTTTAATTTITTTTTATATSTSPSPLAALMKVAPTVTRENDTTAPPLRASSSSEVSPMGAPTTTPRLRARAPPPPPRTSTEANAGMSAPSLVAPPKPRPPGGANKLASALKALDLAKDARDGPAIEGAIAVAIAAGADFDAPDVRAARVELAIILERRDEPQAHALRAIDSALGSNDSAKIGPALATALAAGIEPLNDFVSLAQSKLVELLMRNDPSVAPWCE